MQSEVKDGGPAFPFITHGGVHEHQYCDPGMSLRDWFAGQAMVAIPHIECGSDLDNDELAEAAYRIADKMLAAREEGGGEDE